MSRSPLAWVALLAVSVLMAHSYRQSVALDAAEARADAAEVARRRAEVQAQADSVALEQVRAYTVERDLEIAADRREAQTRAHNAARTATATESALRATLDSLGASTASLDSLVAQHDREVGALREELALADSATANVRGLLQATEAALASERATRLAYVQETAALRAQVEALAKARRTDQWITRAALVAVGVALLR